MTYSSYVGTAQRGTYSVADLLCFPHVNSEEESVYNTAYGDKDIGTVVRYAIESYLRKHDDAEYINVWAEKEIIDQIPKEGISDKIRFMTPAADDKVRRHNLECQNGLAESTLRERCA